MSTLKNFLILRKYSQHTFQNNQHIGTITMPVNRTENEQTEYYFHRTKY